MQMLVFVSALVLFGIAENVAKLKVDLEMSTLSYVQLTMQVLFSHKSFLGDILR